MTPGLVITAPSSGAGKTTTTLGLLSALHSRKLAVQPFKCGPDYIDPAFHSAAVGRPSLNLDSWAMSRESIYELVSAHKEPADIAIAEGAMGLFDGAITDGVSGNGSAADIAAATGWPVVLVLDVSSQAQSAAAVAHGLATFRNEVRVAGVILNKVASPRHEALLRKGFAEIGMDVLGVLPRNNVVGLPGRHLGLVQAAELPALQAQLNQLGSMVNEHCDVDALLRIATESVNDQQQRKQTNALFSSHETPPGQHVAIAKDEAFSFIYPHLQNAWHAAGATLSFFSPLANEAPDPRADVCWLPGGYPELHAERIANATGFHDGMHTFALKGSVHGECGGYMVMGEGLIDADGQRHGMLGLLGLETSFAERKRHLGYRQAILINEIPGHSAGSILRGHEFHYSTVLAQPDTPLADVTDAAGQRIAETGAWRSGEHGNTVSGSYFHLIATEPQRAN